MRYRRRRRSAHAAMVVGPQLGEARTQYIQFGIEITAKGGPVSGLIGTVPVPMDWPEQQIRVVSEKTDDEITKVTYRTLGDTVNESD